MVEWPSWMRGERQNESVSADRYCTVHIPDKVDPKVSKASGHSSPEALTLNIQSNVSKI